MKTRFAIIWCIATLACQICFADEANTNAIRAINFNFQNAPIWAGVQWLIRLKAQPVIVPVNVVGTFTYKSDHALTRDEAIEAIASSFQTNGWYLMYVDHSYYRLLPGAETNASASVPHVEVELGSAGLFLDGKPVPVKELTRTITPLVDPETEIWVHDTFDTLGSGTSEEFVKILVPLSMAHPKRICTKHLPKTT